MPNALGEVREAVDFLRYYAQQVNNEPVSLAWGPVLCISPWNFPLAIFIGQLSAALAAGNVVLAKPAEQTPLIAQRAVQLLHQAGIPRYALQLLPGRESCEIPFIAETGGQNAMIVDSSALPEQVVQDVLSSAFDSAGQRCSALRILLLQEEIANHVLTMLQGAMCELCIGRPDQLATYIGPVIDSDAQQNLQRHINRLKPRAQQYFALPTTAREEAGTFIAPTLLEITSLSELTHEVFGPVLHVLCYRREQLPQILETINAMGYGLTLGIHSRIDETISFITSHAHVGNIYVNRNIVGAVVGVQPFGGEGKSGTGPKAGGALYLKRLQRHPDIHFAKNGKPAAVLTVLADFQAWAKIQGYVSLQTLTEQYRQMTLFGRVLNCPGPTGESNTLSFAARGTIVCIAKEEGTLLNQLAAVLATGNVALVDTQWHDLVSSMPASVQANIRQQEKPETAAFQMALVLVESACLHKLYHLFAAREGTLVPVIATSAEEAIALWRLVAERALCINTAAAGGNTSLMTLDQ